MSRLLACCKSGPLLVRELHAAPVVISCLVLVRELDPKGFVQCRLGVGETDLEFDRFCADIGGQVYVSMCRSERTVVRLRDLGDYVCWRPTSSEGLFFL